MAKLFTTLVPMTDAQVVTIAEGLHADNPVVIRIDPLPAYLMLVSSASRGLPHEIDLAVVGADMAEPLGMTQEDRDRLMPWANDVVRRVCTTWKRLHPPPAEA